MRRALFVLGALVLLAAALEIGVRLADRVRGSPFVGARSRAKVAELFQALSEPWAGPETDGDRHPASGNLQPFTGWEPLAIQERIADDLDRYRQAESAEVYDVCLLGGSGAVDFTAGGGARLVEALARDPRLAGREVRVHAYGIEGFKQPQQERLLAYLLSFGHRPDAVIELDGLDEADVGWRNARAGTSPLYPDAEIWGELTKGIRFDWEMVELLHELDLERTAARSACDRHLRFRLDRSASLDHASSWFLGRRLARIEDVEARIRTYLGTRGREAELVGPRTSGDPADIDAAIVSSWEEASIDMHAMCASRGIAYLHVLEAAGPSAGAGVERVHPHLRSAGKQLSERGIAFLDATDVLADRPEVVSAGSGRLGVRGMEILAESAARALPVR